MWRVRKLILVAYTLAVVVAAGCGGSPSGGDSASNPAKANFIKKADVICTKADQTQKTRQLAFQKKYPEANETRPWQEKIVVAAGLPSILAEAEELGSLTPPSGDESEINAIVLGMKEAVRAAAEDPRTMLQKGSSGPFSEVITLAREYGFKACSNPL